MISLLKDTKAPPYARWSAIWTLDAIEQGKKGESAIIAALKDQDPTVRMQKRFEWPALTRHSS